MKYFAALFSLFIFCGCFQNSKTQLVFTSSTSSVIPDTTTLSQIMGVTPIEKEDIYGSRSATLGFFEETFHMSSSADMAGEIAAIGKLPEQGGTCDIYEGLDANRIPGSIREDSTSDYLYDHRFCSGKLRATEGERSSTPMNQAILFRFCEKLVGSEERLRYFLNQSSIISSLNQTLPAVNENNIQLALKSFFPTEVSTLNLENSKALLLELARSSEAQSSPLLQWKLVTLSLCMVK